MHNIYNKKKIYIYLYRYIHIPCGQNLQLGKNTPESFIDTSISAKSMQRFKPLSIAIIITTLLESTVAYPPGN